MIVTSDGRFCHVAVVRLKLLVDAFDYGTCQMLGN